jgi:hypothetical protein
MIWRRGSIVYERLRVIGRSSLLGLIYKLNLKKAETTEGQGFQPIDRIHSLFAETLASGARQGWGAS